MASSTSTLPTLLWAHKGSLGRTPLELLGTGGAKPGPLWVPVIAIPLTALAEGDHVTAADAKFTADGISIELRFLAHNRSALRALARTARKTKPAHPRRS